MTKYRRRLPQLDGRLFLTDGGLETTLVYHHNIDLPFFAAFDLLRTAEGRTTVGSYFEPYIRTAGDARSGFVLESATWRASRDWGDRLGYAPDELADANRQAVAMLADLRKLHDTPETPVVVSGCVGPRGDGYDPANRMGAEEARAYHAEQIAVFAATEADMVTAMTMNYVEEAIGIVSAAQAAAMPCAIAFTLETDGRLPTGQSLREAIADVDSATGGGPAYYMINCAHPTHFRETLPAGAAWVTRIRGLRANASKRSHAELDAATELDAGDPEELGRQYQEIRARHPHINVLGGCCGTDHRHVHAICHACAPEGAAVRAA